MSDSFADLWNSTAPGKPAQPTQARTLGSITPTVQQQRRPQNDAFSVLSASSTRSNTPSYVSSPPMTKTGSTGGMASGGSLKPIQKSSSSGVDAFGDLLSGSLASNSNGANLTIAQKAALADKQRLGQQATAQSRQAGSKAVDSAWSGLDALGTSGFTASRAASVSPKPPPQDDWIFDSVKPVAPATSVSKAQPAKADDDWGLDDFISKPAPTRPSQSTSQSLWHTDDFSSAPAPAAARASPVPQKSRSSTPGSFDFGDRENGLLDDHSGDEDDILGALGKPSQPKPRLSSASQTRAVPSPQPSSGGRRSRAVSPPPHILGQIVEMGFSIQQARVALAATDNGLDVQAALETLLANGAGGESRPASSQSRPPRERESARFRDSDEQGFDDHRSSPQRIPPRRDRMREPPSRDNSSTQGDGQKNIQDQANEILAQASTIGLSMFNRANALWKEGKEKVQKVYEERAATSGSSSSSPAGQRLDRRDNRPKWMQDSPEDVHNGWKHEPSTTGSFQDDPADDALPPHPSEPSRSRRTTEARPVAQPPPRDAEPSRTKTGDLLGGDEPKVYVSPFRRKVPTRSQGPTPAESKPPPPRASPAPAPAPLIQRKCVPASPSELATSAKHKTTGTEMFKLGRYAEAETAYSHAIAALPDSHLLLVPLYNNRALTRIKTGDHSGAVEDCTTVLKLVGAGYHPSREAKVTKEEEGASVDLADAYVKALRRRAEAYEGREKWEAAKGDWENITAIDFAGKARTDAVQAASRCRRMLAMNTNSVSSSAPPTVAPSRPKPRPKPTPSRPNPSSEALSRVREANQAAEAEDQEKHALKDIVDAKLLAWKGGKETNLRALIASLDTILWPELGLQKTGMHELITPSQVKIRYTKTIAKLHPDKLNARNTTLEQRMIANGVFGALNEAWNSFKP